MSKIMIRFTSATASALVLGAMLSGAPALAQEAPQVKAPTEAMVARTKRAESEAENRIEAMHQRLRITPAQEEAFAKVAQVMRDNRTAFHAALGDKDSEPGKMSAVDDLKSFQIIADEHSNGLKRLIPVFEQLYAAMTPEQRKRADQIFAHRERFTRR